MQSNQKVAWVLVAGIMLTKPIAAGAKDTIIIKEHEKVTPVQQETTTTTTTPDSPVIIHDPAGTTIVQPSTTTETRTIREAPVVEKKVEIKKKKTPRHLINFFGIKIL